MSGSAPRYPTRMTLLTPPAMRILLSIAFRDDSTPSTGLSGMTPPRRWRSTYHVALTTAMVDVARTTDYNHGVYRALRIAVVIPAYNERDKIAATVATVPALADHVLVVDDASGDDTSQRAERAAAEWAAPEQAASREPARVEVL